MKLARFNVSLPRAAAVACLAIGGVLLFSAGCAVGPNYSRPTTPVPETYAATNIWKIAEPRAHLPKGDWWKVFGDPELDQLESDAADANQDLKAAFATFEQARAFADVSRSGFFPHLGLSPSYSRERDSANRPINGVSSGIPQTYNTFTVPLDAGLSTGDAALDRVSFATWLTQNRFDSKPLRWYANYVCRDDYGALASDVSAWAGLHYFASRETEDKGPLTWPEGNGWIVKQLLARVGTFVRSGQTVRAIVRDGSAFRIRAGETEYRCRAVIFAAPTFLASYLIDGMTPLRHFEYSPWITANLTLDSIPDLDRGEPAWDNVVMNSPALGYVDAMHQSLRTFADRTVWTFYWALADGSPSANRRVLLERDWTYWKEAILSDLERVHPRIRSCVSRLDVMRNGHAMVRPSVGAVLSPEREFLKRPHRGLLFAHSDVSGLSLFEEAQYRGVTAADRVLQMSW